MNILPKKRWHVRTKDNIARVRRDEAEAREQEQERQKKLEFAESEVRINFLRKQSGLPEHKTNAADESPTADTTATEENAATNGHVNLFADYKSHIKATNKDLEKEKKDEQEKYEKQIGYLTYLGQDTNEALKLRSWYEVAPKRTAVGATSATEEKDLKSKHAQDPLTLINALLPPEKFTPVTATINRKRTHTETETVVTAEVPLAKRLKIADEKSHKKHKKAKKHKTDKKHKKKKSSKKHKEEKEKRRKEKASAEAQEQLRKRETIERLRKERLRRETIERARQEALLKPPAPAETPKDPKAATTPRIVQKYNSQFNPELAKQNML